MLASLYLNVHVDEKYNYKTIKDQIINNTFLYNSKIFHLYQEDSMELGAMNLHSNDTAINPYSGGATIHREEFLKSRERLSISSKEKILLYSKNVKYESYLSCCYIIKFNHNLYFYIGSTSNLIKRIQSHNTNVLNVVKNLPYIKKDSVRNQPGKPVNSKLFDYFIKDEIRHIGELSYKILPIYLGYNYLKKFLLLYPDYKLSRGEWILLSSITDFIIKLLEQSLINYFNPRLNELHNVAMRH